MQTSTFERVFTAIPESLVIFIAKDERAIRCLLATDKILYNVFGKMIAMYGSGMSMQAAIRILGETNAQFLSFVMLTDMHDLYNTIGSVYVKKLYVTNRTSLSDNEIAESIKTCCNHPPINLQQLIFSPMSGDAKPYLYLWQFSKFENLHSLFLCSNTVKIPPIGSWFPPNLTSLDFGESFNEKVTSANLLEMPYLSTLTFGALFDQELPSIPDNVQHLTLGEKFSHNFNNVNSNLETLTLHGALDIDNQPLPSNLQKLFLYGSQFTFGQNKFPASLVYVLWPLSRTFEWIHIISDTTVQRRVAMFQDESFRSGVQLYFKMGHSPEIAYYLQLCDEVQTLWNNGAPLMHFLAEQLSNSCENPNVYTKVPMNAKSIVVQSFIESTD